MVIVRYFWLPILLITFTAYPNWLEVQNLLQGTGLSVANQSDFDQWVYDLKIEIFMDDWCKRHIFGHHIKHYYRIEYEKHGLSNTHLLLLLQIDDHILDPATIVEIICAKFSS
jgi:hypothetical protein